MELSNILLGHQAKLFQTPRIRFVPIPGYRSLSTVLSHQEALGEMRQLEGALTYLLTSRTLVSMFNMKAMSLSCSYCSGTVSQASYSWTLNSKTEPY